MSPQPSQFNAVKTLRTGGPADIRKPQSIGRGAATEHTAASGTATEHTENDDGEDKQADNQRRGADTGHTAAGGAATEHTEDNYGDDKQADNQREAISVATEHTSKPVARRPSQSLHWFLVLAWFLRST